MRFLLIGSVGIITGWRHAGITTGIRSEQKTETEALFGTMERKGKEKEGK